MIEDSANVRAAALKIKRTLARFVNKTPYEWVGLFFDDYYSDFAHQFYVVELARQGDRFARTCVELLIRDHVQAEPWENLPEPLKSYACWKLAQELPPARPGRGFFATWPRNVVVAMAVIIGMDHGLQRTRTRNKHGGPRLSACALAHRELANFNMRLKETYIERLTDRFDSPPEWVKACARFKPHSPAVLGKRPRSLIERQRS